MSVGRDQDIFQEDVDGELPKPSGTPTTRPWWRRPPTARTLLVATLLAALGFTGGVLTAKHKGVTSASGTAGGAQFGGAGARTGATTGQAGGTTGQAATTRAGSSTIGTVKLIDGSTIYVTTTDGSVVKVTTSGATKLSVSATGKATDLKAGQSIVVVGTTDASGGVTATSVTESATTTAAAAGTGTATGGAARTAGGAAPSGAPAAGATGVPAG